MAKKIARVLVDSVIDGQPCKCGELIEAEADVLKPHLKETLDDSKAGIDYALSQNVKVRALTAEEQIEGGQEGEATDK